jgi:hypothetical protein
MKSTTSAQKTLVALIDLSRPARSLPVSGLSVRPPGRTMVQSSPLLLIACSWRSLACMMRLSVSRMMARKTGATWSMLSPTPMGGHRDQSTHAEGVHEGQDALGAAIRDRLGTVAAAEYADHGVGPLQASVHDFVLQDIPLHRDEPIVVGEPRRVPQQGTDAPPARERLLQDLGTRATRGAEQGDLYPYRIAYCCGAEAGSM